MSFFHKIQKHFVSKIDYFIKKKAEKEPTASQIANIQKHDRIAKMRDNIVTEEKAKKSIWDDD